MVPSILGGDRIGLVRESRNIEICSRKQNLRCCRLDEPSFSRLCAVVVVLAL